MALLSKSHVYTIKVPPMPLVGMPLMGLIVVYICTIFKAKYWVSNTTGLSQIDFHNHSRLVEESPWVSSLEMVFIPPRSRPPKQGLYGHQM